MFASAIYLVGVAAVIAMDGDVVGLFAGTNEIGGHAAHKHSCIGKLELLNEIVEAVLFQE